LKCLEAVVGETLIQGKMGEAPPETGNQIKKITPDGTLTTLNSFCSLTGLR
jgi:hypothetical protein